MCSVLMVLLICAGIAAGGGTPVGTLPALAPSAAWAQASQGGKMTEQGTPRSETLVMDQLNGRVANARLFNPYLPGVEINNGLKPLFPPLWEMDTMKGEMFPAVAAEPLKPLNAEFTRFQIKVRPGIYWSDGVEFTVADIAFTIQMLVRTEKLPTSAYWARILKPDTRMLDKYTLEIQTVNPYPRLQQVLGTTIASNSFRVVAKHIWEKQDPTKFENYPPVTISPYVLKSNDPNGQWFLYERRPDWQRTDTAMVAGEPKPKYILYRFWGPEEKRILAAIQNDLDILMDITPESWDILRDKNKNAQAWLKDFPYAAFDDPCVRGVVLNTSKVPYDKREVRWALALATDIQGVSMATFNGMLRVSPLPIPPTTVLQKTYMFPMESWLAAFALPDGYKPFDPSYAEAMAKKLTDSGIKGVPTDRAAIRQLFGVGWWKFDTAQAAKLLQGQGFKKDARGKWQLPDGKPWTITINAPNNFEVESMRLAFAVADSWKKFGIDVTVKQLESAPFNSAFQTGDYEADVHWPGCGVMPDVYTNMDLNWHQRLAVPNGTPAAGNNSRFKSAQVSAVLDELGKLTDKDPKVVPLTTDFFKLMVAEAAWLPMFGTSKFVPVTTHYWTGFPTAENPYEGPWWWWTGMRYYLTKFKPTGNVK